jgi:Tfp pilus assembly protein PilN
MIRGDSWVIAVGVLGIMALLHLGVTLVSQGVTLGRIDDELRVQRQDSIRYSVFIAVVDSLEALNDTLQRKADIIRQIDSDRFVWAHILNEVSESLPEHTWLNAVRETAGAGSEVEFRIDGMTGQTAGLTRFMRDLEGSPFIQDVRLQSDEQVQQGPNLVHSFVLLARYQIPDPSEIVTEPIILAGG